MYVCVMQHSWLETLLKASGPWAFLMMEKYRVAWGCRTSGLLLDNRSQVRDNGIEHERIDILHSNIYQLERAGAGTSSAPTINDRLGESKPRPVSTLTGRLGSRNYLCQRIFKISLSGTSQLSICPARWNRVHTKIAFTTYCLANKKYIPYNRWLIVIFILIPDSNWRNPDTSMVK